MSPTLSDPKRRSRRKHARPAEIVDAALALFTERGFAATRLEDVATHAGIGKGTIYLYFPTKEDLFRAVVRQRLVPNLDAIEAMIAGHTDSSAELLRRIAARAQQLIASDITAIPKLVLAESGNFPAIARLYAEEVASRGMAMLEGVIARGIARGEFRQVDPHDVIPLFIGPILLMALWRHSLGRHTDIQFDPHKVIETHLGVFLRGLAAETER
ncbi:MAG TPA: TetR/AcrR family transcriptional regulator [Acetobacteraceae bacterium]|nr:TetR/AcrR family transcriptional regulator [Acetobacteraceae bacterium]